MKKHDWKQISHPYFLPLDSLELRREYKLISLINYICILTTKRTNLKDKCSTVANYKK